MISPSKVAQTYIDQYNRLLESARRLNDTPMDQAGDPREVFVRQQAQVLFNQATVTLTANLEAGTVGARYEAPTVTNLPNSAIAFRLEGELLRVQESALPTRSEAGKRREFSIELATGKVADETTSAIPQVTPNANGAHLQGEVNGIGALLQPNGWLVHKPWS